MLTISQGTAYENQRPIILHVIDIYVTDDYHLIATFSDGITKDYDFSKLLTTEAFRPLRDFDKFKRVTLDYGVPTWKEENLDISPETIYANGVNVEVE